MDLGPDFDDGLTWVFTLGEPQQTLLDAVANLLLQGRMDWVIVPIHGIAQLHDEMAASSVAL